MVNSVSKVTQDLISSNLSLQHALEGGYGNYSAIARMLKPKIEETLGRGVKLESVTTAVKRAKADYALPQANIVRIIAGSTTNLRTDIAKITIEKTKGTLKIARKTLAEFSEEYLQIIEGISAITLVFDQKFFDDIYPLFRKEEILDQKRNLAAIMLHSPREIINTPGCLISFYNTISRRYLNIEETMSCFTDTIIILSMEDVGKAFTILTELITEARRIAGKP